MSDGRSVSRRIFVMGSLGSALLAGCGGGKSPAGSLGSSRGAAQFTILWPELKPDSRLIPTAAKSITVKLVGPATAEKTVARPPAGTNQTTVSFPDLEVGDYAVTATAYPNTDGTGTAQATGTVSVTIVKGQTASESLTMGTTITKVTISPARFAVAKGNTTLLTATAYDASSTIVLTEGTWTWASSDASKATVSGTTTSGTVTGVASGSVTITATESESGKFGSSSGSIGFTPGGGLANSSWPRDGANQRNTFYSPVPGGTNGTQRWTVTGAVGGSPVIDSQGNLYFTGTGKIYRVTPTGSSSVFFNLASASNIAYCITLDNEDNVIFSEGDKIHHLNKNGAINWTYTITPPVGRPNTINRVINIHNDESILFGFEFRATPQSTSVSYSTYSFSKTGSLQWSSNTGAQITLDDNRIIAYNGVKTDWLYLDGTQIPGGFTGGAASIALDVDGTHYFSGNNMLTAVDSNRNKVWEAASNNSTFVGISPNDTIIVNGRQCFSPSGTLLWNATDGFSPTPILLFGKIAISKTTLYVCSAHTGFSNPRNGLYAIDLSDGSVRWKKAFDFSALDPPQPVLGPDGTVYFIFNGLLYAFR